MPAHLAMDVLAVQHQRPICAFEETAARWSDR